MVGGGHLCPNHHPNSAGRQRERAAPAGAPPAARGRLHARRPNREFGHGRARQMGQRDTPGRSCRDRGRSWRDHRVLHDHFERRRDVRDEEPPAWPLLHSGGTIRVHRNTGPHDDPDTGAADDGAGPEVTAAGGDCGPGFGRTRRARCPRHRDGDGLQLTRRRASDSRLGRARPPTILGNTARLDCRRAAIISPRHFVPTYP